MLDIINQAQSLDRRRQAQIENQKAAITRLLNASIDTETDTTTPGARYTEEMGILHQTIAVLTVERDEAREALHQLVAASDDGDLADAFDRAHTLLGTKVVSDAVTQQEASAG